MIFWLLSLACLSSSPPPPALVIVVDQLRADELGAYGNLPTDTPRIDALAARGTRFTRAYAASTSVGPSRTSLKTGLLPPQHGHREEGDTATPYGAWLAHAGWDACDVSLIVSKFDKDTFELNKCVSSSSRFAVVWIDRDVGSTLASLDDVVGQVADIWDSRHRDSIGSFVGLVGSLNSLRSEAAVLLTDDMLRVPLLVWGAEGEQDWEIGDVISTARLGQRLAILAGADSKGQPASSGRVYHESTVGYTMFGARPLTGFTEDGGRYVEGVFGRWYPALGEVVRHYEDPQSGYPDAAMQLKVLSEGMGRGAGLPPEAWTSSIDPSDRRKAATLIAKFDAAMIRGRPGAARRILMRLEAEFPASPVLARLRSEVSGQSD